MYKDKKRAAIAEALKGKTQKVAVVNEVTIADKPHKPVLPTLHLSSDNLKELESWKVGNTYTLILEVEQTSMRQGSEWEYDEDEGKKNKVSASFKVKSVKVAK